MTFFLPDAPQETGLPPLDQHVPDQGELAAAGYEAERLETDGWNRTQQYRAELLGEITDRLGDAAPAGRIVTGRGRPLPAAPAFRADLNRQLQAIAQARSESPEEFGDLPATLEEFESEITRRLRRDYDELQAVLGAAPEGSWAPALGGRLAAAATDQEAILSLPFGAAGKASLLRTFGVEFGIGAASEFSMLGRQEEASQRIGAPEPDALMQVLTAGVGAGVLGTGVTAAGRLLAYRRANQLAAKAGAPKEASPAEIEAGVDRTQQELEAGSAIHGLPDAPGFGDFDYSPNGNASPVDNRIGYVFGKLLERGYEPHIAAGFVANAMQESSVGLNPGAVGDGGNAFGLWQWNGPRRHAFLAFAQGQGKQPTDIDTQIAFLEHELRTSESAAWSKIQGASTARDAAILISQHFERPGIPHLNNRVRYAALVYDQFSGGTVPRWTGPIEASNYSPYRTDRGYTAQGQVLVGDDQRIDVAYQVVDLNLLRQASGDLQPRDRARTASDAWVADTAARLDPALLLPSPTADRGAPIVGPDNIIESGNGRVRAIERAYAQGLDRIDAYRQQIEAAGFDIPEGVDQPVLIARRTTDLDAAARRSMVVDAQDSGVARMTATERAQVGQRALDADLLAKYQPGHKLGAAQNRDFARGFAGAFPRSERNAFIGDDGAISIDGTRQMRDSLFARAWDAPDILRRAVEEEPGEMKSLLDALADAAPEIARLRAEIDAGLVRAEMDITPYVLDALRMIIAARAAEGPAGEVLKKMLADVDLFEGPVAPLTRALVQFIMPKGRQIPAARLSEFLRRYAAEARKAGRAGDSLLEDVPGPLDVLKRIAPKAFGDLTETGTARLHATPEPAPLADTMPATAYRDGAASPEAEAAADLAEAQLRDAAAKGPFGPVIEGYEPKQRGAKRSIGRSGELPEGSSPSAPLHQKDNPGIAEVQDSTDALRAELEQFVAQNGDLEFDLENGLRTTGIEFLDDLDADQQLLDVLNVCVKGGS